MSTRCGMRTTPSWLESAPSSLTTPCWTDRSGLARRRPLLRVILDSRLRLPLESRVVKTAHEDLIVFCCFAEEDKRRELESLGVTVEQVPMLRPPGDNTIVFPAGGRLPSMVAPTSAV